MVTTGLDKYSYIYPPMDIDGESNPPLDFSVSAPISLHQVNLPHSRNGSPLRGCLGFHRAGELGSGVEIPQQKTIAAYGNHQKR
jgi:hypothetical protein